MNGTVFDDIKKAIGNYKAEPTEQNLSILVEALRSGLVWVPCNAVFSDADMDEVNKAVMEAEENGDPESLVGQTFVSQDEVRMVPDILQNSDNLFFPIFSSDEEMGEYGEHFSIFLIFLKSFGKKCRNV